MKMKSEMNQIQSMRYDELRALAEEWVGECFLPKEFLKILFEEGFIKHPDIDFLYGGVDHIEFTGQSFIVYDRCICHSDGAVSDGTTRFLKRYLPPSPDDADIPF